SALPVALRLGNRVPDWRSPDAVSLSADWHEMKVPGAWESQGLPDFDGIVWFTRTVEWQARPPASALLLGSIGNVAEVWVNGDAITAPPSAPGVRNAPAVHALPEGAIRPGTNRVTVRIRNFRRSGGFLGDPGEMYIEGGGHRVPLAGT